MRTDLLSYVRRRLTAIGSAIIAGVCLSGCGGAGAATLTATSNIPSSPMVSTAQLTAVELLAPTSTPSSELLTPSLESPISAGTVPSQLPTSSLPTAEQATAPTTPVSTPLAEPAKAQTITHAALLGLQIPPMPAGWTARVQRPAILTPQGFDDEYSIWQVVSNGHFEQLWLVRFVKNEKDGKAIREIVASVDVLSHSPGDILTIDLCEVDSHLDPAVVAIAVDEPSEWLTKIKFAWRIDETKRLFEPVLASKVRCRAVLGER